MGLYLRGALKSGILRYVNALVCRYLYDCVSGKERGGRGGRNEGEGEEGLEVKVSGVPCPVSQNLFFLSLQNRALPSSNRKNA